MQRRLQSMLRPQDPPAAGSPGGVTSLASTRVAPLQLGLLRGFELRQDGDLVQLPLSAQRVVAFLALHDRPLQRLYVAGSLWLDATEARANASLRTALWRLGRPSCRLVEASTTHVALAADVTVDVRDAKAAAQSLIRGTEAAGSRDALYEAGEILPDWYMACALLALLIGALAARAVLDPRQELLGEEHVAELRGLADTEPGAPSAHTTSRGVVVAATPAPDGMPLSHVSLSLASGTHDVELLCDLAARALPGAVVESAVLSDGTVLHVLAADVPTLGSGPDRLASALLAEVARRRQAEPEIEPLVREPARAAYFGG